MRIKNIVRVLAWLTLSFGLTLVTPTRVLAHCDGLDGPVVKAGQRALDTRNPAFALMWVQATDEPEIRTAFERTLAVRVLSPQAMELADRFFFETLPHWRRCAVHGSRTRRARPGASDSSG